MSAAYGINPTTGRCRQCGKLQTRMTTNGTGHAVEVPAPCPCPKVAPPKPKRTRAVAVDADRRRACICQRCDEPTVGKPRVALYCEAHRKEARDEARRRMLAKVGNRYQRTHYERHRERKRASARAYYQTNPAERERRNEYKRLWRKANREKVRAQKERAALKNFRDPSRSVKRWRSEVEAGERKPIPARRNQRGERLCCRGLCRQVVTGHARMCDRCKVLEAKEARQAFPTVLKRAA